MQEQLRLRHKLIPYLYSANYRTPRYGEPICMPMYYRYDEGEAYELDNQYIFGGQLMVCPITQPADKRLNLAKTRVWLPEGRWTDIFNGRVYNGDMLVDMYRDIDSIPVLASAGSIVPMYRNADTNNLSLDQPLEIHLWRGDGYFELYEDDGETNAYREGKYAITEFNLEENGDNLRLTITPPADSHGLLPDEREMYILFRDVVAEEIKVSVGREPVVIELKNVKPVPTESVEELRSALLTRVQGSNDRKNRLFAKKMPAFVEGALAELDCLEQK